MRKIRMFSIVSIYLLVPVHLCAMYEDDGVLFNEVDPTRKPLLQQNRFHKIISDNQNLVNNQEKMSICSCHIPNFLSCLSNILSYWGEKIIKWV